MIWQRHLHRRPEFLEGVRSMLPQVPGLMAWGLMTGVASVHTGLHFFDATLMALLVYAGSSQLSALPLMAAGAPAWVILATAFCVNLRFVVFSLHLREYLMHLTRWQRMSLCYFTTDLSYVLFIQRFPEPAPDTERRQQEVAFLAGNSFVAWVGWIAAILLGVVLAQWIPEAWGLGFAGSLCLLGILCSLLSTKLRFLAAVLGAFLATWAYHLPLKLNILLAIGGVMLFCWMAQSAVERWQIGQKASDESDASQAPQADSPKARS